MSRPPAARWPAVAALGTAQTIAWGSTYYLPAVVAAPQARELGLPLPLAMAAFSLALVVSALVGPAAGRALDRRGGHAVLPATSVGFAVGLLALSAAQGPVSLFAAWALLGVAMGAGLYDAAFATLVRVFGADARGPITGVTLVAGFASTVGWPLSALWLDAWGWRGACVAWAAVHLLVALPLNAALPRHRAACALAASAAETGAQPTAPDRARRRAAIALSAVFAFAWFNATAMATHLPALLQAAGASTGAALAAGALIGPAQVAARALEFGLLRRVHPLASARAAALAHPLGAAALAAFGAPATAAFALLHGAGNGVLTIAKGTLPLALFGSGGYGARQGWLMMPSRIAQAAAPVLFGVLLEAFGAGALAWTAALGLVSALLLWRLPAGARR